MELDDILSDKPQPKAEPKVEPVIAAEPVKIEPVKAERPRDEEGKFVEKQVVTPVETQKEPIQQDLTPKERAAFAAAADERRKRQLLEQEIAQLRQKPVEPPKPFWDDPDGAIKRSEEGNQKIVEQVAQMLTSHKMQNSEYHARQKYADFDEKVDEFSRALAETPGLQQQFVASPDPAEFVYKVAKNRIELREVGNIDQLMQKKEKEIRLKIEAEYKAKAEADAKLRQEIPGSLSEVAGTPGQNKPVWNGPTPLAGILAGR